VETALRPVLDRVRLQFAFITAWVKKVLAMFAPQEVRLQRMCPFCGLITSRSKRFCLECGKSFGEIQLERQTEDK
jgi:hypothetical protein